MIYFVDEDVGFLKPWVGELRLRGHKVQVLPNADIGFGMLANCELKNVALILIDVMLAVGEDAGKSRYTRSKTQDYLITGLCLLDDLVTACGQEFTRKVAFLTSVSNQGFLQKVQEAADKHNTHLLRKSDFSTPFEFADTIEKIVGKAAQGQ